MAFLSKIYPLLLLPAVALFVWRFPGKMLPVVGFVAGTCLVGIVGFLPFLSVGLAQLTEGLRAYVGQWKMNEGLFALIQGVLPSPFPWYALPLAGLLVLRPREKGISSALVVLSGSVGLYYLSFFYEYHDYQPLWWSLTRIVEHAVIWLFLLAPCLRLIAVPLRNYRNL